MTDRSRLRLSRGCYTVGWICPLPIEMTAAMSMLDETHLPLPQSQADSNTYVLGRIHTHDVVLACLPEMGLAPAATVARQMKQSFPDLRCALLVGIGGGIPSEGYDIRLGDVVVGVPGSKYGSVVQWDYGKTVAEGKFVHYGVLNDPPAVLLTAVNALRARYNMGQTGIVENLEFGSSRIPSDMNGQFSRPSQDLDVLFKADYDYEHSDLGDCQSCDKRKAVLRGPREKQTIVHFGTIASGNQVIKHGRKRDEIGATFDALCLEMEAAGIVKDLPCIVIRGICDYSDSHKNKTWQGHAAMAAAAFARDILSILPSHRVKLLDPGYLFNPYDSPVRVRGLNLPLLAREENIFYQDYWHESRILERGNDARSSQFAIRQDERQLLERLLSQPPGQGPNFEMEPKLAEFMHEYRSELLEQLADFPNPQQQRGLFAAMLRMTKGSLDHDSDTCRTLLHWLAMNGVSDVLPKLIDIGFDVNHKDSDWQTPLHLAVIENHFPTVAVLVQQCHADVHAKDLNGLLAWHHALHIDWDNCADNDEREKSRISIIRLLAAFTNIESIKGAKARKSLSRLKTDPEAVILL